MASLPRISTASESSSTLTRDRKEQVFDPTGNDAFNSKVVPALPRLEGEIAYPPTGTKDHGAHKALLPVDATSRPTSSIMVGFVGGVALAISHHIFLKFLNGRNIDEYHQYWVKNANNALSALFSMCIAFVATSALIQMKWKVARSRPLSIRSIDNLFALPSPYALFTTVTSTQLQSLRLFLLPIFAATFIQFLALVSVFAPNALTVARSAEISRDLHLRTLDLSTGPLTSVTDYNIYYWDTTQEWTTVLTSIMLQPPILNWQIPPGCGAACKFDLVYDGPGLQCMDTPLEPPPYTPPYTDQVWPLFYNATSTLYQNPGLRSVSLWEIADPYELRIGWVATGDNRFRTERDGGSVHCVFRNATYKASFQVENNTMQASNTIQSYGGILGTLKYGDSNLQCSQNLTEPCYINGVNTRAMCEVFASAFTGKIQVPLNVNTNASGVTGGVNVAVVDLLFSHASGDIGADFNLTVSNLGKGLVNLFSDLTLGFIPHRNDTKTVQADIWDGSYVWSYNVWILWVVYLPTLLLASLVTLNGLLSIRSNKRGMDDKFSNFLLATKDIELAVVCIGVADFEELQQLRLLYQREKGTFSVVSAPSEGEDVKRRFN